MSEELKRSPLYDFHASQGARFVPFAGWEMPVQYTGIIEEHRAVREAAGLFDVSHMGEAVVTGPETWRFLNYLVPRDLKGLRPGRARYSPMCYPEGGCVDDLIIYCRGPEEALICLNAANSDKDIAWMQEQAIHFECRVRDASAEWAQLAVQGPRAIPIVAALAEDSEAAEGLKKFRAMDTRLGGKPVFLSRTGYTGEDGFEIYCRPEDAPALASEVLERGREAGIRPVGLGARDSLRLEAGMPLYGHEIDHDISPVEGGLAWTISLEKKEDYVGRSVIEEHMRAGPPRRLIFFMLEERRIAREGAPVFAGREQVGEVRSGTQSPSLNKPIGSALVGGEAGDEELEVEIRTKRYALRVTQPPLHTALQ